MQLSAKDNVFSRGLKHLFDDFTQKQVNAGILLRFVKIDNQKIIDKDHYVESLI